MHSSQWHPQQPRSYDTNSSASWTPAPLVVHVGGDGTASEDEGASYALTSPHLPHLYLPSPPSAASSLSPDASSPYAAPSATLHARHASNSYISPQHGVHAHPTPTAATAAVHLVPVAPANHSSALYQRGTAAPSSSASSSAAPRSSESAPASASNPRRPARSAPLVLLLSLLSILGQLVRALPLLLRPSTYRTLSARMRAVWRQRHQHRRLAHSLLRALFRPRTLLLSAAALGGLVYLLAFLSSCRTSHGCKLWPFGLSRGPPPVPFTILSLLRDMSEESLARDRAQFAFQWNALFSWTLVVPPENILIFMDTEASCRRIERQPEVKGMRCMPVPCWHAEYRRPLLDCIFNTAADVATTELLAYVNGDIVLHHDTAELVSQAAAWFQDFLLVSRRTDTLVPGHMLDEFNVKDSRVQVAELLHRAVSHGELHSEFGIDLFVYPRRVYRTLNFPPYLAGVYRWDNWLLSELLLREDVAVIDATRPGLVVHQELGKVGHQGRTGASWNDGIAKGRSGLKYRIGNIANADYVIEYGEPGGEGADAEEAVWNDPTSSLRYRLTVNHNASVEVLIAKRVSSQGWLAVVPVSHFDLEHGHLDNFLCWALRLNFSSFVLLASDRASGRELRRRGVPVLVFDEGPEEAEEDPAVQDDGESVGPRGSASGGAPSVNSYDFLLFRDEFLSIVLRFGFHFFYTHLNALWVEDPLALLHSGGRPAFGWKSHDEFLAAQSGPRPTSEFDVAAPGNDTWLDSGSFAVRSTQWGKQLWRQVSLCDEAQGSSLYARSMAEARGKEAAIPAELRSFSSSSSRVVDCLNEQVGKLKAKLSRLALPLSLFPSHEEYFVRQVAWTHGTMPAMIRDDARMSVLDATLQATLDARAADAANQTTSSSSVSSAAPSTEELPPFAPDPLWSLPRAGRISAYKAAQIRRWDEWKLLAIDLASGQRSLARGADRSEEAQARRYPTFQCIDLDPQPLKPPVSMQQWDKYQASIRSTVPSSPSSAKSSSKPRPPPDSPLDFSFKIRVITFDRPRSLARLLDSLTRVDWEGDRVGLEVSIDHPSNMTDSDTVHAWRLTQSLCDSFQWTAGAYSVIHQSANIGLTGQWTWGWNPPAEGAGGKREIICFLEDDTALVPLAYRWIKHVIRTYYLDPTQYDPNLFGFSLQSQHTVLGESKQFRYGSRLTHHLLGPDEFYYRYQLLGTWGTVFFPEHWRSFTRWLRSRSFQHTQGTSSRGFRPCVPALLSNAWWNLKPKRVWSQWFVRFAFERGWYSLYTNFRNQSSLVVNFREGGLNFKTARGPMNPALDHLPPEYMSLPSLKDTPLLDFHFRDWRHQPSHLKYHWALVGASIPTPESGGVASPDFWPPQARMDECYTVGRLKGAVQSKDAAAKARGEALKTLQLKYAPALETHRRLVAQADHLALVRSVLTSADAPHEHLSRQEEQLRASRLEAEAEWSSQPERERAERMRLETEEREQAQAEREREREQLEREQREREERQREEEEEAEARRARAQRAREREEAEEAEEERRLAELERQLEAARAARAKARDKASSASPTTSGSGDAKQPAGEAKKSAGKDESGGKAAPSKSDDKGKSDASKDNKAGEKKDGAKQTSDAESKKKQKEAAKKQNEASAPAPAKKTGDEKKSDKADKSGK